MNGTLVLWLHIGAMLVAFALLPGLGIAMRVIVKRSEPGVARAVVRAAMPLFAIGGGAVGVGVISGLILASKYGYTQTWLIWSYVLMVILALLGNVVDGGWARRLAASNDANYESVRDDALARIAGYLYVPIWLAILWLMLAKPGA